MTAPPRKSGRWSPRPRKSSIPKIKLTATCVRVPVFIGHSEAVNIEFVDPISADEAREILRRAPGCLVIDRRETGGYITPARSRGGGRDLHFANPRRPDNRQRHQPLGGVRQSAQGRGAQCGANRGGAGRIAAGSSPKRRPRDQSFHVQGDALGNLIASRRFVRLFVMI